MDGAHEVARAGQFGEHGAGGAFCQAAGGGGQHHVVSRGGHRERGYGDPRQVAAYVNPAHPVEVAQRGPQALPGPGHPGVDLRCGRLGQFRLRPARQTGRPGRGGQLSTPAQKGDQLGGQAQYGVGHGESGGEYERRDAAGVLGRGPYGHRAVQ